MHIRFISVILHLNMHIIVVMHITVTMHIDACAYNYYDAYDDAYYSYGAY